MATFPLTKCLHPDDYKELEVELAEVNKYGLQSTDQHPYRKWEYAMALRAHSVWRVGHRHPVLMNPMALDIGGAGSPLVKLLNDRELSAYVIDPAENYSLEKVAEKKPLIKASVVTCTSTVEHVENLDAFLPHLAGVVASKGLLFITSDIWGESPSEPDKAHFHWMRKRIFTPESWWELAKKLEDTYGFKILGAVDLRFHREGILNNQPVENSANWGYSFASMALVKG